MEASTTRDKKGKEQMRTDDAREWAGPDLKKTKMASGSGGSLANWWTKLGMQMRLLRSALRASSPGPQLDLELHELLLNCLSLYNSSTSSEICIDKDGPTVISDKNSGQHSSSLEGAFIWLGGWRPTSALVLVYSVLGGESQGKSFSPAALLQTPTSELSDKQLPKMVNLQKHTQKAEQELSSKFAMFQMLLTDQIVVKALVSEEASIETNYSEAHKAIQSKIENLQELLKHAENLRLQTLQELFNLLTPVQSARCSIAAFELVFALKTLSTTQFGDSFSVHQQHKSISASSSEVSGTTTSNILLEGSDLYDTKCLSKSVDDNPVTLNTLNTSMEPLHFQVAGEM
ncbi:hypothetical protein O6H91_18G016900 [Diphasiastrum complanatum]|uniref:Uncharacterized protein n=1 Tax=Diphasiastrum complanatum TaxID=34168 RepID=A0ACC2AYJ3_DIPCM|nr:hypothetical protein O6H91_18G016900 [Diphasiastrum complanatum]